VTVDQEFWHKLGSNLSARLSEFFELWKCFVDVYRDMRDVAQNRRRVKSIVLLDS
jgi:hypothetical protein